MDVLRIHKKQKNKCAVIRKWVSAQTEKTGQVLENRSLLVFVDDKQNTGALSFHTHPLTNGQGGYQPPSLTDLKVLLSGALNGVVKRHYVLCNGGMYVLRFKRTMTPNAYEALMKTARRLQREMLPSRKFHNHWIKEANKACPTCFSVEFVRWECL